MIPLITRMHTCAYLHIHTPFDETHNIKLWYPPLPYIIPGVHISWLRYQMETFTRYWPFVLGIHRSPVNSPHKGQWRGALMFSFISISKQMSLPPFVFLEANRHIRHFLIDKLSRKHFVSLSNHTYGIHKCAGFWWKIREKLVFFLWKLKDSIQRR